MINDMLPVVILAGGLATRLRPVTERIPKALIDINGRPFIDYQLQLLASKGITEVVMCLGYLGEMVEAHVGNGSQFNLNVSYCYDGEKLLGTSGAIKRALPLLQDEFFVTYGDSYLDVDYLAVQSHYFQSKQLGLMTVFHNQNKWDASNVCFENGVICIYDKFNRSNAMEYIDYGLGVLSKRAFEQVCQGEVYDLADLYQSLVKSNSLAGFEVDQRFFEIGSFKGIEDLSRYLQRQTASNFD